MSAHQLALLYSVLVLIPLAGWKITRMVKILKKISNRGEEDNKGLTTKQIEFVEFLENTSN